MFGWSTHKKTKRICEGLYFVLSFFQAVLFVFYFSSTDHLHSGLVRALSALPSFGGAPHPPAFTPLIHLPWCMPMFHSFFFFCKWRDLDSNFLHHASGCHNFANNACHNFVVSRNALALTLPGAEVTVPGERWQIWTSSKFFTKSSNEILKHKIVLQMKKSQLWKLWRMSSKQPNFLSSIGEVSCSTLTKTRRHQQSSSPMIPFVLLW